MKKKKERIIYINKGQEQSDQAHKEQALKSGTDIRLQDLKCELRQPNV